MQFKLLWFFIDESFPTIILPIFALIRRSIFAVLFPLIVAFSIFVPLKPSELLLIQPIVAYEHLSLPILAFFAQPPPFASQEVRLLPSKPSSWLPILLCASAFPPSISHVSI